VPARQTPPNRPAGRPRPSGRGHADAVVTEPAQAAAGDKVLREISASALARDVSGTVSIARQREYVREFLAKRLVLLLSALLAAGLLLIGLQRWTHVPVEAVTSFFQLVFSPVIALVSAATGFYFGTSTVNASDSDSDGAVHE